MWLVWALRSFRRFTLHLHCITALIGCYTDGGNKAERPDIRNNAYYFIYLERIMYVIGDKEKEVRIQGGNINNLKFADDIDILEEDRSKLQENMNEVRTAGKAAGLNINVGKTKTFVTENKNIKEQNNRGERHQNRKRRRPHI